MFEDKKVERSLDRIATVLEKIYKLAIREEKEEQEERQPTLTIIWIGANKMAVNDVTLNLTAPFGPNQGIPVETNPDGSNFVYNPTNIQWAIQDPTIASFVQNADGSATFTPLKAGSTSVAVQDTSNSASATGVLTVTQPVSGPPTMSISWNAPVGDASASKVGAK